MALCKLEGQIILTATTAVGTFAGAAVSVGTGVYFLIDFIAAFKSALDTATGRTWTLTLDDDTDSATGKLTIACSGAATTATWTSTAIRDALGFTVDLALGTSWQGANHSRYLWLPNCGRTGALAPDTSNGAIEVDMTTALAPSGRMHLIAYTPRYYDVLAFGHVRGFKLWAALETIVNESFETFYTYVIGLGRAVRYYSDRSNNAVYREFYVESGDRLEPTPLDPRWIHGAQSLWTLSYNVRKYV